MDSFEKKYLEQFGISGAVPQYLCYFLGVYAPRVLATILYKRAFLDKLDLNSPKDLNEKINWLEFKTDTSVWSLLADKLLVRKFVMMQGYGNILPRLYGAWDNTNSIDFEALPKSFVLKCNHDSGSTQIVLNKTDVKRDELLLFLRRRMNRPYGVVSAEPHYRRIKRFVYAEELILGQDALFDGPINYKFWCFYGNVSFCHIQYRLKDGKKGAEVYRLPQWQYMPNALICNDKAHVINAPLRLNEMMVIAATLSRYFPQCRVDLYESRDRIFFGELTFTAGAGRINDYTSAFLNELGEQVVIPNLLDYRGIINGIKSHDTI